VKQARRRRIATARSGGEAAVAALSPRDLEELAGGPAAPADQAPRLAAARLLSGPRGARVRGAAERGRPWWRRASALRVLARAGAPDAVPALRDAFFSGDRDLARAAAALLAQAGSRAAAEVLVDGLIRETYSSSRIATAIERTGAPVSDLVRPLLRSESSRLRYWAALLLAGYPGEPGLDAELAAATRDSDPRIRKAAIQSLGAVGGALAEKEASRLASDPVDFVRTHAAMARARAADAGAK
jgi:HEAT repeat protein